MAVGLRMCWSMISSSRSWKAKFRLLVMRSVVLAPQCFSNPTVGALLKRT